MEYIKILAVGATGAGKTSLLYVYTTNAFPDYWTSFEALRAQVMINASKVDVHFWDSEASEAHDRLRALSYPETSVFLLCFSLVNRDSFNAIRDKFYDEVMSHCGNAQVLLLGLKSDLLEDHETLQRLANRKETLVSTEECLALASQYNCPFMTASALTNKGVKEAFEKAYSLHLGAKGNNKFMVKLLRKLDLPERPRRPVFPPAPKLETPKSTFRAEMKKMFRNQLHSDLVITVVRNKSQKEETDIVSRVDIPCHLFVIEQAPKFYKYCVANMESEIVNQKKLKKVRLEFDYPELIPHFVEFLYLYDVEELILRLLDLKLATNILYIDEALVDRSLALIDFFNQYIPYLAYRFEKVMTGFNHFPNLRAYFKSLTTEERARRFRGCQTVDEIMQRYTAEDACVDPVVNPFTTYFERKPRSLHFDVSFSSDYKIVPCHWAMLCARSEFFNAMKEGATDELVQVDEENKLLDIPIVKQMTSSAILLEIMEYIYTDKISESLNSVSALIDLHRNAGFFLLDGLSGIVQSRLATLLDPVNVLIVWKIAKEDNLDQLLKLCRFKLCEYYDEIVKQNLPTFDEETKIFALESFQAIRYPTPREIAIYSLYLDCISNSTMPSKEALARLNIGEGTALPSELKREEHEKCIIQ